MVGNANLALAIALPVGIVALLVALILAAWLAGRRRRNRTDPLEASAAAAVFPATHHALYGKSTSGSAATTTTAATSTTTTTADASDTASGDGDVAATTKSSRNPFRDLSLSHSRSVRRKSYREDSLWHGELDEVLDDRDWAPLEAGWREPKLQRQQQQLQHAQMRRAQSNGGYVARPQRDGRGGDMPGTSSRMSTSERMVFGLTPGQDLPDSYVPPVHRSYSSRNSLGASVAHSGFATGQSSRSGSRPPPNVNGNATSRGPGSVYGGASSSTLKSLRTVPEVPTQNVADSGQSKRVPEGNALAATAGVPPFTGIEEGQAMPAAEEETKAKRASISSGMSPTPIDAVKASDSTDTGRESPHIHQVAT